MFQSAPPVKGAILYNFTHKVWQYVSIRAPREGGDMELMRAGSFHTVSIRAPREGGDPTAPIKSIASTCFNPRPP